MELPWNKKGQGLAKAKKNIFRNTTSNTPFQHSSTSRQYIIGGDALAPLSKPEATSGPALHISSSRRGDYNGVNTALEKRLPEVPVKPDLSSLPRDVLEWAETQQRLAEDLQRDSIELETQFQERLRRIEAGYKHEADQRQRQADSLALIAERKDLFFGPQLQDAIVVQKFTHLLGLVKAWANKFGENEEREYTVEHGTETKANIGTILPGGNTENRLIGVLRQKRSRKRLIRSWIALTLCQKILSSRVISDRSSSTIRDLDRWLELDLSQAVAKIEDILAINTKGNFVSFQQLNDWRAFTTTLLANQQTVRDHESQHPADSSQESDLGRFQHVTVQLPVIREECLRFVQPLLRDDCREDAACELDALILLFITFSRTIRCQRAFWTVEFEPHGMPNLAESRCVPSLTSSNCATRDLEEQVRDSQSTAFDSEMMDDCGASNLGIENAVPQQAANSGGVNGTENRAAASTSKTVHMRLAPSLFKSGDAAGCQYEIRVCMVKAVVSCS